MRSTRLVKTIKNFVDDETAPTMVEYGMLLAFVVIVVIALIVSLGPAIAALFEVTAL